MGENNSRDWRTLPSECQWRFCTDGYLAHPDGTIKSVDKWVNHRYGGKALRRGKILKPKKDKHGYLQVMLYNNGEYKTCSVHRLIATAFLSNPDNLPCINHKDENPLNNTVENLEWCTYQYNNTYGTHIERVTKTKSKPVQGINPSTGKVVVEYPSVAEAGRKGYNYGHIASCCRGERKTHKGLIWHYKDEYKPIMV